MTALARSSRSAVALSAALLAGCAAHRPTADTPRVYGTPYGLTADRETVTAFTLINGPLKMNVIDYGAIITELHVPGRDGKTADVVLGYDKFEDYQKDNPYFGCVCGRFANRIGGAKFTLDGTTYDLSKNDKANLLHGGKFGFDKRRWAARPMTRPDGPAVRFTLTSPDGDQGFPGEVKATVVYTLTKDGVKIEYEATTSKPTVVNLTNHTYWNLTGKPGEQTVIAHTLQVDADRYTAVGPGLIPTGELPSVEGTGLDFRKPRAIGDASAQAGKDGLDHNLCLTGGVTATPRRVATVREPTSGRVMDIDTDQPGLQVVDTSFMKGQWTGKGGVRYQKHAALILETQHYPDSPNQPSFPTTTLRPGETFRSVTKYTFRTE